VYSLILLNGGIGKRAAAGRPKQLVDVNGIPILVYSLVAADAVEAITEIVLNYPPDWREDVERIVVDYAIKTPVVYVEAGASRHESVARALGATTGDHVVIHESARPMVSTADFEKLLDEPNPNVSYMLPIAFTVAPVDPSTRRVTGSLERDSLRNVQLPQKFEKAALVAAHEAASKAGTEFTEDATLVASHGADVFFLEGHDRNIKVTTPLDVRVAGFLLGPVADDE